MAPRSPILALPWAAMNSYRSFYPGEWLWPPLPGPWDPVQLTPQPSQQPDLAADEPLCKLRSCARAGDDGLAQASCLFVGSPGHAKHQLALVMMSEKYVLTWTWVLPAESFASTDPSPGRICQVGGRSAKRSSSFIPGAREKEVCPLWEGVGQDPCSFQKQRRVCPGLAPAARENGHCDPWGSWKSTPFGWIASIMGLPTYCGRDSCLPQGLCGFSVPCENFGSMFFI